MSSPSAAGTAAQVRPAVQFVGFRIDAQEFAFPIERIQEIVVLGDVTRVPQVADCVEGVTNLRGSVIPVIDLRRLFGLGIADRAAGTHAVVVDVAGKRVGCRVDSVTSVIRAAAEDVHPAPETIGGGHRYVTGFLRHDGRILVLLDSTALLDPERLEGVQTQIAEALAATRPDRPAAPAPGSAPAATS